MVTLTRSSATACGRLDSSMTAMPHDHGEHAGQPQRAELFAEHDAGRGRADERHQQRERHHLRRGMSRSSRPHSQ